jgi:hypothetical protein
MKKREPGNVLITLSSEQVRKVNAWISPINIAHFVEECLPPGFDIVISVSPGEQTAVARCGSQQLELGEVTMDPLPGWVL